MKQTIWKYVLEITDTQTLRVPKGSELLAVAEQDGLLCLWALVTPARPLHDRLVTISGTGNPFTDAHAFLGTVVMSDGLVWHVFQDKSK